MKTARIAEVFAVSASWARRIKQRRCETGETAPRSMGGATVVKIDMDRLHQLVEEQPDATTDELHRRLRVDCTASAVDMDNLNRHKRKRTRKRIEAVGAALVFLPPYSPDLNPIEMIFSKVKRALRSLGCRTREALWGRMQSVLDTVTSQHAAHCYRHGGYTLHVD